MSDEGKQTSGNPEPDAAAMPPGSGPGEAGPAGTAAEQAASRNGGREEQSVGELVFEISDRASVLIRDEIELAKTEISEKVNGLLKGSVVGVVAGVFVLLALAMLMHAFAWLLNDLLFEGDPWAGFLIEAGLFLLIAAIAGLLAYRWFKKGAPPTPDMAIEEAKEIRAAFDGDQKPAAFDGEEKS